MEAKELMIGDWVNIFPEEYRDENYNVKVDRIVQQRYCRIAIGAGILFTHKDLITPIPLTEEILKANGFGRDKSYVEFANIIGDYVILYNTAVGRLSIDFEHINNGKGVPKSIVSIPLRYVHEFQHALRLCGFSELADNFKIDYGNKY